jgi:hypothetical protein
VTLRITFEVLPHGDVARAYPIGSLYLTNTGGHGEPDTPERLCHYDAVLVREDAGEETCTLVDFPRNRRDAFDLALWALIVLRGEQNADDIYPENSRVRDE